MLRVAGVVAVLAAAVGATAALGGFRAAPVHVPAARPGVPVGNGQLVVAPRAARYGHTDPTSTGPRERGRYLALAFRVTNVSEQTTTADEALSPLHMAVTGRPAGTAISDLHPDFAVGPGRHTALHPDMPQRVLMVAKLPRGVPVPREVAVTIHRDEYRPGFMDEHKAWHGSDEIAAEVTVPVRVAR